jgi:hypothetical protein
MKREDSFAYIRFCFEPDESSPETRSPLYTYPIIALFNLISNRNIIIIIFNRRILVENLTKHGPLSHGEQNWLIKTLQPLH